MFLRKNENKKNNIVIVKAPNKTEGFDKYNVVFQAYHSVFETYLMQRSIFVSTIVPSFFMRIAGRKHEDLFFYWLKLIRDEELKPGNEFQLLARFLMLTGASLATKKYVIGPLIHKAFTVIKTTRARFNFDKLISDSALSSSIKSYEFGIRDYKFMAETAPAFRLLVITGGMMVAGLLINGKISIESAVIGFYILGDYLCKLLGVKRDVADKKSHLLFLADMLNLCEQPEWNFNSQMDTPTGIYSLNVRKYHAVPAEIVNEIILASAKKYNLELTSATKFLVTAPTTFQVNHSSHLICKQIKKILERVEQCNKLLQQINKIVLDVNKCELNSIYFSICNKKYADGFSLREFVIQVPGRYADILTRDAIQLIFKACEVIIKNQQLVIKGYQPGDEGLLKSLCAHIRNEYFLRLGNSANQYMNFSVATPSNRNHKMAINFSATPLVDDNKERKLEDVPAPPLVQWPTATYNQDDPENKVYSVNSTRFPMWKRFVTLEESAFGNLSKTAYDKIKKSVKVINHVTHERQQGVIFLDRNKPVVVRGQKFFAAAKLKMLGEDLGNVRIFSPRQPEVASTGEELFVFNKVIAHSHTR